MPAPSRHEADEAFGGMVAQHGHAASCPRRSTAWTRAPLRSLSPVFDRPVAEQHVEADPGVDTARRLSSADEAAAAPYASCAGELVAWLRTLSG